MLLSWGGLDSCAEERNSETPAHRLDVAPQRGFTEARRFAASGPVDRRQRTGYSRLTLGVLVRAGPTHR